MASSHQNTALSTPYKTHHNTDAERAPETPEPEEPQDNVGPPGPPRSVYRVKRRRAPLPATSCDSSQLSAAAEAPVPSTEISNHMPATYGLGINVLDHTRRYPTPEHSSARMRSVPRTPLAQMSTASDDDSKFIFQWDVSPTTGGSSSRPSSSCSGFSDSSLSSFESSGSYPSFGDSCTSPESDAAEPPACARSESSMDCSPAPGSATHRRPSTNRKASQNTPWTEEKDTHLLATYMRYIQDPMVTPFKMLPGSVPPLGVCHRVAREAKRSWKKSKIATALARNKEKTPGRAGSPDTIRSSPTERKAKTIADTGKSNMVWPHSESATRKRLRELCKHTPLLSAHYQRLLYRRSPSPYFASSPYVQSSHSMSPYQSSDNLSMYDTREINISLATSTASTMQPGAPLNMLSSERTPKAPQYQFSPVMSSQPNEFQHCDLPSDEEQSHKSPSYPSQPGSGRRLGSPFQVQRGRTWTPEQAGPSPPELPQKKYATVSGQPLDTPIELHAPIPLNRSLKRRAQQRLEDGSSPNSAFIQELFGNQSDGGCRRVRARGFSLGDMGGNSRGFAPIPREPPPLPLRDPSNGQSPGDTLAPPAVTNPVRRLGSPFKERASNQRASNLQFRTFPRNAPSLEARMEAVENASP